MTNFQHKITQIRNHLGLSRRAFGALLGIPEAKIQKIEIGAQRADHEFLTALAKATAVDLNWLLKDIGQVDPVRPGFEDGLAIPLTTAEPAPNRDVWSVVPYREDAASTSSPLGVSKDWLAAQNYDPKMLRLVTVSGDSMAPGLSDGDHVIMNMADTHMRDGVTYVFQLGADVLVKCLQILPQRHVNLCSANPAYSPILIELGKKELSIVGRVVAAFQKW